MSCRSSGSSAETSSSCSLGSSSSSSVRGSLFLKMLLVNFFNNILYRSLVFDAGLFYTVPVRRYLYFFIMKNCLYKKVLEVIQIKKLYKNN